MYHLCQNIEDKAGMRGPIGRAAEDPPGVGVTDKGHVDESVPGRQLGEIGKP